MGIALKVIGMASVVALWNAPPLHAMEIKTCGNQVILSGKVEGNEYARLKDVFSANPHLKTAVLRNSPGGHAETGYRVGEFFRENEITTYVSGYCRSSCSRFFLGGKERYFTDDYPAGKTHVGFHSNYKDSGEVVASAPWRLQQFVKKYSDGKADEELVQRWVNLQNRKGFAYFFHPEALKRKDGVSVFLCQGDEPGDDRWPHCEKIKGHDALSMGVVTSLERKQSCDAATID
jgi:hypothetical protein